VSSIAFEPDADVGLVDGVQYATGHGSRRNEAAGEAAKQTLTFLAPDYVRAVMQG
jgi:hypothetical protein